MRSIVTLIFATMVISSVVSAQVPIVKHVFIVVEENEDFSCVIGNPAMKFLNEELAAKYGLAASYYANARPSTSNYFMLTIGQALFKNLHLLGDKRLRPVDADNVIRILKKNGKSWRAYVEDVKSRGYTGKDIITSEAHYVKRHNPLAYFEKDIPSADRANLAPFSQLTQDLNPAHLSLANYSFIVPNLLDDAHDVVGANGKSQTAKCGDPSALKQ